MNSARRVVFLLGVFSLVGGLAEGWTRFSGNDGVEPLGAGALALRLLPPAVFVLAGLFLITAAIRRAEQSWYPSAYALKLMRIRAYGIVAIGIVATLIYWFSS